MKGAVSNQASPKDVKSPKMATQQTILEKPEKKSPSKASKASRKILSPAEIARLKRLEQYDNETQRYKQELQNLNNALDDEEVETIMDTKKRSKKMSNFNKLSSTVGRIKQANLD